MTTSASTSRRFTVASKPRVAELAACSRPRHLPAAIPITICVLLFAAPTLQAQNEEALAEDLYEPGSGSVSLSLQYIEVSKFNTSVADVDIGSVTTRSAYVELEYAASSRWLLNLGVPYVQKDYDGPARHDPLTLDPPRPEVAFIDDGRWHGNLQDFVFGVHYLLAARPLQVEPFVYLVIPSHDYPHFAQAAVGQNLWRVELGLEATHFLPFSDWYYRLAGSYVVVEETLGTNVNHFRLGAELGYFFTPDVSARGFVSSRLGRGYEGTAFPPSQRTDERWYQHDRTSKHNYVNVGIGADCFFAGRYELSGSVFTTVWGNTVHLIDYAVTGEITRYF